MAPIDFSALVPPPEDAPDPHDLPFSRYSLDEALVKAEQVSVHLHARQTILRGLADATVGPREITDLVVSDPALAARVLKTVNSPYYGLRHQQASVFRAVLFLGHLEVRNIVLRACMAESLAPADGPLAALLDDLWQHSFTVSRTAYALAKLLKQPHPDEIATAALLHDVGKLVSLNTWPEEAAAIYSPLRLSDQRLLADQEPDLGVGHARLGEEIAGLWGLPRSTSLAIGLHHVPLHRSPDAVEGNHRAIAIVHLADLLAHLVQHQLRGEPTPAAWLPREGWMESLGVTDGLRSLCTSHVVLALLPPHMVRGEMMEEDCAAAA